MVTFYYCKRCGRICISDESCKKCDCCGAAAYPVPQKYWDEDDVIMRDEQQKLLREELVKTSPVFDEDLFNRRDDIITSQVNRVFHVYYPSTISCF